MVHLVSWSTTLVQNKLFLYDLPRKILHSWSPSSPINLVILGIFSWSSTRCLYSQYVYETSDQQLTALTFVTEDIHGAQRINHKCRKPLTFHVVSPVGHVMPKKMKPNSFSTTMTRTCLVLSEILNILIQINIKWQIKQINALWMDYHSVA